MVKMDKTEVSLVLKKSGIFLYCWSVIVIILICGSITIQEVKPSNTSCCQFILYSLRKFTTDYWTNSLIAIVVHLLGILATVFDHFYLSISFGVLYAINTALTLWLSTLSPAFWLLFFIYLFVTFVVFFFADDIRKGKQSVPPRVQILGNDVNHRCLKIRHMTDEDNTCLAIIV